jgi:hypothetical protein
MKRTISIICCLAIVAAPSAPAMAQSAFGKAVKAKYELKSVSCYTCHMKSSAIPEADKEAYEKNKKSFRNAFGKSFEPHLKGQDISKKLAEVKELDSDDPKKVAATAAATAAFLKALEKVEAEKAEDGKTYGEHLKAATLSGVKPKPAE